MQSRYKPGRFVALFAALALVVAACGDDDDSAADDSEGEATETGEEGVEVAFLLPGSTEDEGYNADGQRTADAVAEIDGVANVQVTESVPVPNQADVYRQFANEGFDIIIGWGGQFTDGAVQVSEEFPDQDFIVVNSNVENGTNLASMDTSVEQWQFLGGYATARLSDSDTIGWVGGQCFEATAKNLHGTEQGAQLANPNVEVLSTFTGDFEDPTAANQAAEAMIGEGAGALTGNLNNGWFGVFEASAEAGNVPLVTEWVDNSDLAPDQIAGSILKSQAPFVVELVEDAVNGELEYTFHLFDLPDDWGPVISSNEAISPELAAELEEVQEQIVSGEITVESDTTCPS